MASTIKDIAKTLGVSVSTVSYALNGGPRPVREDIREKVLEAARLLDYRPNHVARSLITRRSHTIGIVPTETATSITRSPYFQGCLEGIVNESEALGQDVLLYTRFDQREGDKFLNTLLDGRADGVIFLAPKLDSPLPDALGDRIPAVIVSSHRFTKAPTLGIDNRGGVEMAVKHLVSLGHTKIGHVHGRLSLEDGIERLNAFKECLQAHGLEPNPAWMVDGDFTPQGGYRAGEKMLCSRSRPTAVFCANDESATGFMRAAHEVGLRVPDDLSIVGFDDSPASGISYPSITTVRQPLAEIGSSALSDLVRLIEGQLVPARPPFHTELIVRDSTSCPKEDK